MCGVVIGRRMPDVGGLLGGLGGCIIFNFLEFHARLWKFYELVNSIESREKLLISSPGIAGAYSGRFIARKVARALMPALEDTKKVVSLAPEFVVTAYFQDN